MCFWVSDGITQWLWDTIPVRGQLNRLPKHEQVIFSLSYKRNWNGAELCTVEALFHKFYYIPVTWADEGPHPVFHFLSILSVIHQDNTIIFLSQYHIQLFLPTSGGSQLPFSLIKEKKKKKWKVTIIFFNQHSYEWSLIIIALNTLELQSTFQTLTNESRIQGGKAWSSSILSFQTVMGFRLGLLQLQE